MQQETSGLPAITVQAGDTFALKGQPYEFNVWRKVVGLADSDDLLNAKIRYVRIFQGTATIAAQHVLLRTPINLPDGFYRIVGENHLVFCDTCEEDIKSWNVQKMTASEKIPREHIHRLLLWVSWCLDLDRTKPMTICIERKGFWLANNPKAPPYRIPSSRPGHAVDLPIPEDPIFVDAFHLELALLEITRYDTVVIAYEKNPDQLTPLFLGRNWNQCSLVMTKPPYLTHSRLHGQ